MKKYMQMIMASVTIIVAIGPGVAHAAGATGGTITFQGQLEDQTCNINGNNSGSNDFTVTLPVVGIANLASAGEQAGTTDITMALTGCSTTAFHNVGVDFTPSGGAIDSATQTLENAALPPGGATNVSLILKNEDGTQINLGQTAGSQNVHDAPLTGGDATLKYTVSYYALNGPATVGTVAATLGYTLTYK